ncbi:MAG: 3-oxoacyl-ACP reductase FabG [Gammaproteobacteria bacterium]
MNSDSNRLENEITLVTGASRGIGAGIAKLFGESGSYVLGTATTQDGANAITHSLNQDGSKGEGIVLDVSDAEAVSKMIKDLKERDLLPSILVNNAGISLESLLMRIKDDDWKKIIDTNLSSAFYLCKAAVSGMMKNRKGRIINIGSVVGSIGAIGNAHYSASKAALLGFTKSLALEVGSRGITVNNIAPGYITTDMTKDIKSELSDALMDKIPMNRFGSPEDIAKVALFLASESGSYITGQTIHVNGGMHME